MRHAFASLLDHFRTRGATGDVEARAPRLQRVGVRGALRCSLCAAAFVGALAAAPDALAQTDGESYAEADRLEREALASWDADRPAEALPVLERAMQRPHRPRTTAQLGLLEARLGRWVRAEAHVVSALDAPDAWVRENRARIEQALVRIRSRVASLELECNVEGATVWIADEQIGTLPLTQPLRIPVGTTPVEVRAPGHRSTILRVTVDAGRVAHERALLTPEAAPPPAPTQPPAAAVAVTQTPVAQGPVSQARAVQASASVPLGRVLAWIGMGAGALMLIGGGVALGVRQAASANFDDPANNCRPIPGVQPNMNCSGYDSTISGMTVAAVVSFGGAALFGGVSAVLFATSASSSRRSSALRLGPGPGGLGLSMTGSF